jgi:hypothetical protein
MRAQTTINGLTFALWVAICAAAPELIWQGLLRLAGHFTLFNLYAITLIGLVLAFFIEPIMERIRSRRWDTGHQKTEGLLMTAGFAFGFGVAAVCLHEGLGAYLGATEHIPDARQERLVEAVDLILQWACIPFAVTLAWFVARLGRAAAWVGGALTIGWTVAIGWFFEWAPRDIIMVVIPTLMVVVLGARYVRAEWSRQIFRRIAIGASVIFACFTFSALAAQGVLWLCGVRSWHIYTLAEFSSDIRFYLGWSLGLMIAPNPVAASQNDPTLSASN